MSESNLLSSIQPLAVPSAPRPGKKKFNSQVITIKSLQTFSSMTQDEQENAHISDLDFIAQLYPSMKKRIAKKPKNIIKKTNLFKKTYNNVYEFPELRKDEPSLETFLLEKPEFLTVQNDKAQDVKTNYYHFLPSSPFSVQKNSQSPQKFEQGVMETEEIYNEMIVDSDDKHVVSKKNSFESRQIELEQDQSTCASN